MSGRVIRTLVTAVLACASTLALGQWELDSDRSSINFISTKNAAVAESHSFSRVLGYISAAGKVQLTVELDSVETLIDIRNERMRETLFETARFPTARVSAQVEPTLLQAVHGGGVATTEVGIRLSLHGLENTLNAPLTVIGEEGGALRVVSTRPLVVNAADFSLDGGVEALREVAGLKSISTAIPVTVQLLFRPAATE